MINLLSRFFYRISSFSTIVLATAVYLFFITNVMQAENISSQAYAGAWGSPDGHFFYTPDELYSELSTWGEAGRQSYIDFRLGLDIIWAIAYSMFLITITSVALRGAFNEGHPKRRLNLVALIPWASDYSENALSIYIVSQFPERIDSVAWLTACVTALKWLSLGAAHLVMVYALVAAGITLLRRRKF